MTRRRGRPVRQYNVRVRTERRNPIDFEGLARAALEQAAMDQRDRSEKSVRKSAPIRNRRTRKEHDHDDLE